MDANASLIGDAPLVMKAVRLAIAAAQRSHSDTVTAAHSMYMADLRISIAEADARAMELTDRDTLTMNEETQQKHLALSVWEQEGGAPCRLRPRHGVDASRVTRRLYH